MLKTKAYAASASKAPLGPYSFERRDPRERDVLIDIKYCGICHSDIHQVRDEWGGSIFPMVPGHEIAGTVAAIGNGVTKYRVGDKVGVGCFVDSCRSCAECKKGQESYCKGRVPTYNGRDKDGVPTMGGYADKIVVNEDFVKRLRDQKLDFHVWTVNDPDDARYFQQLGVDSITTNRPAFLRAELNLK